jgi:hypothetical protein
LKLHIALSWDTVLGVTQTSLELMGSSNPPQPLKYGTASMYYHA